MLRIPWRTDIGLAPSQICVTLISLIAWSRSPTISAAKRLGGQRSPRISLPSWKLSHLFYIGALAFILCRTHSLVHVLMVGAAGSNRPGWGGHFLHTYDPWQPFWTLCTELMSALRCRPVSRDVFIIAQITEGKNVSEARNKPRSGLHITVTFMVIV